MSKSLEPELQTFPEPARFALGMATSASSTAAAATAGPMDFGAALQGSSGAVKTLLTVTVQLYRLRESMKGKMSTLDRKLLRVVEQSFTRWVDPTPPPELQLHESGDNEGMPKTVDPETIKTGFTPESLQRFMRTELVELMEVLNVLKDGGEGDFAGKSSKGKGPSGSYTLWQVVLELHRWMSTELPILLDERRSHPSWEARLLGRIHYIDELRSLLSLPVDSGGLEELDPAIRRGGFSGWVRSGTKDTPDAKRLAKVLVTLSKHLASIREAHKRALQERSVAEVLQNLEHAIKSVVRPVMHAALVVMSNCELPAGMVFSELLQQGQTDEWSWMTQFRNTTLCELLTDQLRKDENLQRCLHIHDFALNVVQKEPPLIDEFGEDLESEAESCLEGNPDSAFVNTVNTGIPTLHGLAATGGAANWKPLVKPLVKLMQANLVLSAQVGEGMQTLHKTQAQAKMKGEDWFCKCSEDVTRYLWKLKAVVSKMLDLVMEARTELDKLHSDMGIDRKVTRQQESSNKFWAKNLPKRRPYFYFGVRESRMKVLDGKAE